MITRRRFLTASGAALATGASRPPNIVLLLADDMGYGDLSSYGCPDIKTPNIDSIGRAGVRFTRFYANAPECTPTRSALLTGRYQQRVGGLECAIGVGNVGRYDEAIWLQKRDELGLPVSETTMPRILKDAGYDTGCFGKWHLGYLDEFLPNRHGFDEYFGILGGNSDYFTHREAGGDNVLYHNSRPVKQQGYLTDLFVERAVDWLGKRSANPFFLYVPFTAPHTPVQGPGDAAKKIDETNWDSGDRATYARMVERMDAGVAAILAALMKRGAERDTLVIFLSDNGGYKLSNNGGLRGGKSTVWEGGIRVPLLARWPGVLPEGAARRQVGLTMDLLPTVLAATGLPAPAGRRLDGVDLLPVMLGKRDEFDRSVFWRYKRGDAVRKAAREGDMKYIWDGGREELYNLAVDEREQNNLIARSAEVADGLSKKLAAWEREVMAPRLRPFRTQPG